MVVVMKPGTKQQEIDKLVAQFQLQGFQVGRPSLPIVQGYHLLLLKSVNTLVDWAERDSNSCNLPLPKLG